MLSRLKARVRWYFYHEYPMIFFFMFLLSIAVALAFLLPVVGNMDCVAKWGDRGSYTVIGGCKVDGVPEKNVRIMIGD